MRSIFYESWGPRMEIILRHGSTALIETQNASLVLLPAFSSMMNFENVSSRAFPTMTHERSSARVLKSGAIRFVRKPLIPC